MGGHGKKSTSSAMMATVEQACGDLDLIDCAIKSLTLPLTG
jgi:hypothetical protein